MSSQVQNHRRATRKLGALLLIAGVPFATSCSSGSDPVASRTAPPVVPGAGTARRLERPVSTDGFKLGDPIDGLTDMELAAFERGLEVFDRRFKPSEGLGPFYNATSCASCHSTPVSGGSSRLYRNFYIAVWGTLQGQSPIPPFLSPVVPAYGTGAAHAGATFSLEGARPQIPAMFGGVDVTVGQRNAIPLFGTGLFEFVSNATIFSNADPEDANGDEISGRFNTQGGGLGRLGVKAQANNVEAFTRAPLQNQMGITTDPFLGSGGIVSLSAAQATGGVDDPTTDDDGVPDPEMSHDDLGDLIAFTRFLAPPRKKLFFAAERRGEALFDSIGCVKCHIPNLPSSRGTVDAYTDLLLHDMGLMLADGLTFGVPQSSPSSSTGTPREFRTQPLWGVSMHAPYLHDGRAETLDSAIVQHRGEANSIRNAYIALTDDEKADMIAFLEAL
ncbi:MAG: CxxC motif-containing protein (DUF1111 family) [Chlamydiales bacterium]